MQILSIYPNCSLGGMGTVYRNRIVANPNESHWLFFQVDRGGLRQFEGLPNASVRIVRASRFGAFLKLATENHNFTEVRITSIPSCVGAVSDKFSPRIIYEFHTSDEKAIEKELSELDLDKVSEIRVPSLYLKNILFEMLCDQRRALVTVTPNLVDERLFNWDAKAKLELGEGIPIVWVGRFDLGKNVRDFLRLLSTLPQQYTGVVVASFELEVARVAEFMSEAFALRVEDRIRFFLNLHHQQMADLYQTAAQMGGFYCSTSLAESFGYTIAEASLCGLPTVAYDVGALREHKSDLVSLVPVGDIGALRRLILSRSVQPL